MEDPKEPKVVKATRITSAEQMQELMSDYTWSNAACMGYAIIAAKSSGLSEDQIKQLIRAMHSAHDFNTLEEAANVYNKSPY